MAGWKTARVISSSVCAKLVHVYIDKGAPGPWMGTGEFFVQAGQADVYPRQATKPDARALSMAIVAIAKATERKFGVSLSVVGRPKVKHEKYTQGFYLDSGDEED